MCYIKRQSLKELSESLHKTTAYINTMLYNKGNPKINTYIKIANACGYRVVLENVEHNDRIELVNEND